MYWLNFIGQIWNKFEKDFIDKNGNTGKNYNVKVLVTGATININCSKEQYEELQKWKTYQIPIWLKTFIYEKDWNKMAWASYYARKESIILINDKEK